MPDETIPQLLAEAEADISRVTGLTQATRDEVSAVREALTLLRTSSSANFPETIVFRVVQQLESAIVGIESKEAEYEQEILSILRRIARRETPPQPHHTTQAGIAFGANMAAVPGTQAVGSTLTATFVPIEADGLTQTPGATLTTAPVYTIDNPAIATIVDNGNGTATITGVSAGTATVTATGGVFTDSDGTATAPLSATNTDAVTQPTGRTVSAQINFS